MHFDCVSCFLRQAIRTGRLLGCPDECLWEIVRGCGGVLAGVNEGFCPPQNAVALYDMIGEKTGREDPFSEIKRQSTRQVLALYPELKKRIKAEADPIEAAIRFSACGNVIDYGVSAEFDLLKEVDAALRSPFSKWDYPLFLKRLENSEWILFIGDNCGEAVFDRLLIERLGKPVKFAVRGGPIINDVTMQDAVESGLDKVSEIVSTGCRAPGVVINECSSRFRELFYTAPLVISKGQGNFETLNNEDREIFFIFKIKCEVVAGFLGSALNSMFFGTVPLQVE